MRKALLMAGLVALALVAPAQVHADVGPVYWSENGHWYLLRQVHGLSWHEASASADSLVFGGVRGHLATITSAEEAAFLHYGLGGPYRYKSWIGGYQDPPDTPDPAANWYWVTGEPWEFTNWAPNAPNDAGDGEFFLDLYWDTPQSNWNDAGYQANIESFVVEFDPTVPPPAGDDLVWVPNYGSNDVTVVDADAMAVVAAIPVGRGPAGIAVGTDHVWVACRWTSYIYRVGIATKAVTDSIDLRPHMAFPIAVGLDPSGNAYIVGRKMLEAPETDLAVLVKMSPAGQVVAARELHHVQADAYPSDPLYSIRSIGVGLTRSGWAYLPWFRSWDGATGIDVVDTGDLSLGQHVLIPGVVGYCGPGMGIGPQGQGYASTVRAQTRCLIEVTPEHCTVRYVPCPITGYLTTGVVASPWGSVAFGSEADPPQLAVAHSGDINCMREVQSGSAGFALDRRGRLWIAFPTENVIRCYTSLGQAEIATVPVGQMPVGYGDMTGSESVFLPKPSRGACCQGTVCTIEDEPVCVGSLGNFQGDGAVCEPNPCFVAYTPDLDRLGDELLAHWWPDRGECAIAARGRDGAAGSLSIHDAAGRVIHVQTVALPGRDVLSFRWDARDRSGRAVPSGVYFLSLTAESYRASGRVVIVR